MTKENTLTEIMESNGGYITTEESKSRSLYKQLLRATNEGNIIRLKAGLYILADRLATTMIDVEKIVPGGVVCLYSAWAHYELTTHIPTELCIAVDRSRKVTLPNYPPISVSYWSGAAYSLGVTSINVNGYDVRMYDIEKSVCDAVKYRNKIGVDVSSEILKNYLTRPNRNLTRLHELADQLRVAGTIDNLIKYMI